MENENLTKETVQQNKNGFKYNHPVFFVLLIIVCIVSLMLASGLLTYKYGTKNAYLRAMAKIVPYPAAIVNNDIIDLNEFHEEVDALKNLVTLQSEITPEIEAEIKDDVMEKLIHDEIIIQLADKFKIKLSDEEIEQEKQAILEEIGGTKEEVDQKLQESYGWDFDTFFEKVIKSSVYQQKVMEKFSEDEKRFKQSEKLAKEVMELVKDGDESFQDLAKKYSQDRFAQYGGEWGWVSKGLLPVEVEQVAFSMEKGDISDLIKTNEGYYIIKVDDKKEGDDPQVLVYSIFIKAPDFEEYLLEYLKDSKVYKFVK